MTPPFPEFGPEHRALLHSRAGDLYREIASGGPLRPRGKRFAKGSADRKALTLLLELGLLSEEGDQVVAVDPALVQARVVAPLGQQAAELLSESTDWANAFAELSQAFRRGTATDSPLTDMRGTANINRYLQTVVGDAEFELLTAQPDGARSAAILKIAIDRDVAALRRGVTMRTLYQHSARRSVSTREYVARVTEDGAQVRTLDEFFNRLIVVDRRLAVVPASDDDTHAIAIHEPALVAYLADIFERYWERAHEFSDREAPTRRAVADDVHNMTVRMLIEGHSDNASAKRMGVSARTYAGYVAALKEEYGVDTRFQLGHAMGRLMGPEGDAKRPPRPAED
ncbi:TrmB family transcriptional regulator sugar-binding domain-containing protein [Nocardioides terrisoli]|uniref:TrmB family transcriptional regulator sugar-binding domain-containing protein n=1 Tax=Nocardioides terrisoli TaxID=3388267 RepID=UPI00287B9CA2|nr:TrmB family transcriptional regulator sugar-binding domain-containing protein [Nocardioides marmorisolisilvae]